VADKKITELIEKTTLCDNDLFAMVDAEVTPIETKKIKGVNLKAQITSGLTVFYIGEGSKNTIKGGL